MIRRPPRSTLDRSSAASDVYKRQVEYISNSNYFLITGITLSIINDKLLLIELLSKIQGKTTIVFDSNYRKSLWNCNVDYLNVFNQIVKFIDIFLPSDSDLFEIYNICLLYTSDAADERSSVDLGGRRIIKKKNN